MNWQSTKMDCDACGYEWAAVHPVVAEYLECPVCHHMTPAPYIDENNMNAKLTVIDIAKVCHETNRAYCQTLGDNSQPAWESAPDWQKTSAVKGVEFHLAHPDSKPEDSHNSWLDQKRSEGWQYGPTKDPEKKLHPCFVPFTALPAEQQVKDALFLGVVRSMERLLN